MTRSLILGHIGGSGASGSGSQPGGGTPSPVPPPVTEPNPVPPPVAKPGGRPVTPAPEAADDALWFDIARILHSAEEMLLVKLPSGPECNTASAYASCDAVLHFR